MEQHEIDKYFKQELNQLEVSPSNSLWSSIEDSLPEKKRRGIPWFWFLSILLFMGIGGIFYASIWNKQLSIETRVEALEKKESSQQHEKPLYKEPKNIEGVTATKLNRASDKDSNHLLDDVAHKPSKIAESSLSESPKKHEDRNTNSLNESFVSSEEKLTPIIAVSNELNQKTEPSKYTGTAFMAINEVDLPVFNPRMICGGIRNLPNYKCQSKWLIGLEASAYHNRTRFTSTNSESRSRATSIMNAIKPEWSSGLGVSLFYQIKPRLQLWSGLRIGSWQQSAEFFLNPTSDAETIESFAGAIQINFSSSIETISGSSLLNIQTTVGPSDVTLAGFIEEQEVKVTTEESIQWFSVPVGIAYQTKSKTGLRASLGLSYDRLISDKTTIQISDDLGQRIETSNQLTRQGYLSSTAKIELTHHLKPNLALAIGPRFNGWLSPLQDRDGLAIYPYSTSIDVGLQWNLCRSCNYSE